MKSKFYIVEEFWDSEVFHYIFAEKAAAIVAQLLLEPEGTVEEIEMEDIKKIRKLQESVRYTCNELKDVFHRAEYAGLTVDIPILSVNYYNKYFNWRRK